MQGGQQTLKPPLTDSAHERCRCPGTQHEAGRQHTTRSRTCSGLHADHPPAPRRRRPPSPRSCRRTPAVVLVGTQPQVSQCQRVLRQLWLLRTPRRCRPLQQRPRPRAGAERGGRRHGGERIVWVWAAESSSSVRVVLAKGAAAVGDLGVQAPRRVSFGPSTVAERACCWRGRAPGQPTA